MIEVYCDESRPELLSSRKFEGNREKYMIIGGIWIPYSMRDQLKANVKELREKHLVFGEIKWKNVSPSKLSFYQDLVELYFNFIGARFRCIVVDTDEVDLSTFHDSDSELGFYKFYYQLLKHWVDDREKYWIYLDYKKNKVPDRLKTLKNVLNNAARGVILDVQAIESKQSLMIQMTDVLIGAVGYKYNGYETSPAKMALVDIIENKFGHRIEKTYRSEQKFNVFEIDLNYRWR